MGSSNIWIGTIVNIQHGSLSTLKENLAISLQLIMQQSNSIAYIWTKTICIALVLLQHGLIVHRLLAIELDNLHVLQLQIFFQALGELFLVNKITDTDTNTVITICIAWANTILGSANLVIALQLLNVAIHLAMIWQNHMSAVADTDTTDINALSNHAVHFLQHNLWVKGNTIAYYAQGSLVQNTGWHQAQLVFYTINSNSMASIAAALITDNSLSLLCQIIYNLTFAFVTPLGA